MIHKIKKVFKNPYKALHYLFILINSYIKKKKDVLVIIGLDPDGEFNILHRGYKKCYGFEANPERYSKLIKKFDKYKNIHIYNAAVADYDGEIEFNISNNNNGASSSIGNFKSDWLKTHATQNIKMVKKIKINCINLYNFCQKKDIQFIDDYISDIQGMDLQVLRTMKTFVDNRLIGTIRCEVTKNEHKNIYSDLPDNSENGFNELLNTNYVLISKGWGILVDYKFDKIPKQSWEMDCKWELKN